ncbi:hypothetical protein NDU88_003494 [Pleurodeles waltl]|uniref:Uncharacterized protein n=1 Tax=Pleurodeles waltl TaxID=8319 RepID=A0AAV7VGS3_PLEWA|nr:hypothetical protein NDU88_003494 [Pleurodeles waltl]
MVRCPGALRRTLRCYGETQKRNRKWMCKSSRMRMWRERTRTSRSGKATTRRRQEGRRENREETRESRTPTESEEDGSDQVPLWNPTTCHIPGGTWLELVHARIRAVSSFWGNPGGMGEESNEGKRAGRKYNIYLSEKQGKYL